MTDCNIYSDGSRLSSYRSGAAISVWRKVERYSRLSEIPLPNHDKISFYLEDATVFSCEVFGAWAAANWLLINSEKYGIRSATINIDSQACIKALGSYKIRSKMVYKAVQTLNLAANKLELLKIRWVKAHLDDSELHRGNAFADKSAKDGASMLDVDSLVLPEELALLYPFHT